jgi:hypothetical protein
MRLLALWDFLAFRPSGSKVRQTSVVIAEFAFCLPACTERCAGELFTPMAFTVGYSLVGKFRPPVRGEVLHQLKLRPLQSFQPP